MKIHNFRAGFATNSSSSHSIVLIPDDMVGKVSTQGENSGSFGWQNFILADTESKMRYLAAQLVESYSSDAAANKDVVERFSKYFGGDDAMRSGISSGEIYVDHQSKLYLDKSDHTINRMVKLFMSPRVVVLGGNDNQDDNPYATGEEIPINTSGGYRLREDGCYFTLFRHGDGTKMRWSFDVGAPDFTKASTPELVDLKITGWCDAGCKFCYMGSTKEGQHADMGSIRKIVDHLNSLDVFEVAIGGGEPTKHPHFKEIINMISRANIVPNFTTFSDEWLSDDEVVKTVKKAVGGIGVSCLDRKGLDLVKAIKGKVNNQWGDGPKVMAQHVVGSVPLGVTAEFLDAAFAEGIPVLLLGYKTVGFGKTYSRHDTGDVPMFLKLALNRVGGKAGLSIDTALLDRFPNLPEVLGVPTALVTSPEGKFSCYIDATTGTIGPSSYVDASEMLPLPNSADEIKDIFARF